MFALLPMVACWRYEPREHLRPLAFSRPAVSPSPWETGSATPITFDFGAIFPFTSFRPTTSLSTLRNGRYRTPRKTSVRGCSLGFTAAVIADGRLQRACKAQTGSPEAVARPRLPQNVACGFPAPRSSAVGSQLSLLSVQVSFPWSADLLTE